MQKGVAGTGRVKGKVALVTGAASGIGRATALLLVREGANVAVTDIDEPGAQRVANAITENGGESISTKLDVTSESDWKAALSAAQVRWGPINVLVAGAGVSFAKPVTEMSLEEWRRVMEVNLDGVFLGTKHAVRQMREGSGGSIVIVSSASGIKASPGASAYCASKAALRLFAKSVALECAENGDAVRVHTVHPGGVKTPMWRSMDFFQELVAKHGSEEAAFRAMENDAKPPQRLAEPEEIAAAILFLASDESSFVTGSELTVDSGYTA